MLTTEGKRYIKRYMAGQVPSIAESIAVGVSSAAESLTDATLGFEVSRSNITVTSYDFVNDRLVFKAAEAELLGGGIYELALFSKPVNTLAGDYASRLIASFDSSTETWVDASTSADDVYSATNSRIGPDGLSHTPAASATKTSSMRGLQLDLSGNSNGDLFKFAYNVGNAFTASIQFRFMTNASNYFTYNTGAQTAGYKLTSVAKASLTVTGAPNWNNITEIQVSTTSTSGGASAILLDGIRLEDVDTINPDYVLVARKVLATPQTGIQRGRVQNLEYSLNINV